MIIDLTITEYEWDLMIKGLRFASEQYGLQGNSVMSEDTKLLADTVADGCITVVNYHGEKREEDKS